MKRDAPQHLNGNVHKRVKMLDEDLSPQDASVKPKGKMDWAKIKANVQALRIQRQKLPVWQGKDGILEAIQQNDTVIVLGETGSGKTTQIPQFVLDSNIPCPRPRICITQPRRVAAVSLATRVSQEVGCRLGDTVGYTVRFDDTSSPATRLKFVTDGTLLQELLADDLLSLYDVLIVDEAHERTLRTDMVLGFLKRIQARRKEAVKAGHLKSDGSPMTELKIVVMSATLDAEQFSAFFNNAKIIYVQGRQFKVTIKYAEYDQQDYIEAALKTIFQIHMDHPPGDILVFLTGEEEIESLSASIKTYSAHLKPNKHDKILICPLYAKLSPAAQAKVFETTPPGFRKVVLATNVAETSVTIPGIKYVVDTGLLKQKRFHPGNGIDSLLITPVSKSSAQQRAGRAGRESAGYCFRLYTEDNYAKLTQSQLPEIKRCNLAFALLHLLAVGQVDPFNFDFIDKPDQQAIVSALLELYALGAIDDKKQITTIGRQMASLPLDPCSARVLLASFALNCSSEIISLVALLSFLDSVLISPPSAREAASEAHAKFMHRDGDHLTLLNVYKAYHAFQGTAKERREWCKENYVNGRTLAMVEEARRQLVERCERSKVGNPKLTCGDESGPVLEACMAGMFQNLALRHEDGTYRKIIGRTPIKIHPSSVLHQKKAPVIMYSELVFTSQIYARCCSVIPVAWLQEKAPKIFAHS